MLAVGRRPTGEPPWMCLRPCCGHNPLAVRWPRVFLSPFNRHFGMVMLAPLACAWLPLSWCEEALWGERDPHWHCHPHMARLLAP